MADRQTREPWEVHIDGRLIADAVCQTSDAVAPLRQRHLSGIGHGTAGEPLLAALRSFLRSLERTLREWLNPHSKYLLLYMSRRLGHLDLQVRVSRSRNAVLSREDIEREVSAYYWQHRRFTLAALKWGRPGDEDMVDRSSANPERGRYTVPADMGRDQLVRLLAAWFVVGEYEMARYCLKRAGKGGRFVWGGQAGAGYDVGLDAEGWSLVASYDLRVNFDANLLRYLGSWAPGQGYSCFPRPGGQTYVDAPYWDRDTAPAPADFPVDRPTVLTLIPNVVGIPADQDWPVAAGGSERIGFPAWLFAWVLFDELLPRLYLFGAVLSAHLKYSHRQQYTPQDLLCALSAITQHLRETYEGEAWRWPQVFMTGYSVWGNPKGIIAGEVLPRFALLRALHGRTGNPAEDADALQAVLADITWSPADFPKISLLSASPVKMVYQIAKKRWWVDWSMVGDMLQDFVSAAGRMEGAIARLRGHEFQEILAEHITRAVGELGAEVWWQGHQSGVLKFRSGPARDCDLGIVAGDVLLLVDAKAHAVDREQLLVGTPRKLQRRWEEVILPDLNQVDSLVVRLQQERSGRNFQLPAAIRSIVGIVCTTFPEWIPSTSPQFWLYDDIPRVCTPEELWDVVDRTVKGSPPERNRVALA